MSGKTTMTLIGIAALVGFGIYLDRKLTGATSSIGFDVASLIWNNAAGAAANLGGAVLDAMPSSQVPAAVDMAGPTPDIGTILYESALMGGGS